MEKNPQLLTAKFRRQLSLPSTLQKPTL